MNSQDILCELEYLATERTKKIYLSNGAKEPVFGVATGAMNPLYKQIKKNHTLAEELYATGNYDAMYFAGMIADYNQMTRNDFNRWMDAAYFYMLSDFVVAVTLTESPLNLEISDEWILSKQELRQSAGWSCYCWSLGRWKDEHFDKERIDQLLDLAEKQIHTAPDRAKSSMANFIHTVGLSYIPSHEKALETAKKVGDIIIKRDNKKDQILNPLANIEKDIERGRIGFKRKYVRC